LNLDLQVFENLAGMIKKNVGQKIKSPSFKNFLILFFFC